MNKKKLILPVAILTLSTVAAVIMLLFTTGFVYCFTANRNISTVKAVYFADKAYEIEPNYSNEKIEATLYDARTVWSNVRFYTYQHNDFGQEALNKLLSQYPDGYIQKVVDFSKYQYENPEYLRELTLHDQKISAPFANSEILLPIGKESTYYGCKYAMALYLNGETEESQKIVEKIMQEDRLACPFLTDYVLLVHYFEEDKGNQNWMLEVEKKAVENVKERNSEFSYTDYYREVFADEYKPF